MKRIGRRKRVGTEAAVLGFCALAAAGVIAGTTAYLTDHTVITNEISAGWNETETVEEFPSPTPVAPGETVVKKVRIQNKGEVPCYIRAALIVSEGTVTLEGLNTELWVDGQDGYYYYRDVVQPGDSTGEFFTGVKVDRQTEEDTVTVTVYEESIQAMHGSVPYKDYKEAWNYYLGGGGK